MITISGLIVVILGGLCALHFSGYFSKKSTLSAEREVALGSVYAEVLAKTYDNKPCISSFSKFIALQINHHSSRLKLSLEQKLRSLLAEIHGKMNCGPAPSLRWASLDELKQAGLYVNDALTDGLHAKLEIISENEVKINLFRSPLSSWIVDYELKYNDNKRGYDYKVLRQAVS